jgi:mannose-6-phosphate isomerase class I
VVNVCYVIEASSFYIGIVTKGSGKIDIEGQTYPVSEGSKFFVPYETGAVKFESETGMEITVTFPPE